MPRFPRSTPLMNALRASVRALVVGGATLACAGAAQAQASGTILGRLADVETGQPLAGAVVSVLHLPHRTLSAEDGRFVLVGVPTGERTLRVELLGYQQLTVEAVRVLSGRPVELRLELRPAAIAVEGVTVDAERQRLLNPDVTVSHEVLLGRELRELPVDALRGAIELAPGVTAGHFRGGRVGQEVYIVDGLEVKNQLEASTQGLGLEFSPSSLEEVEVITGGFGVEYGSALSGAVSLTTRRGDPERWATAATVFTDQWAPERFTRGFTGVSVSTGGPLPTGRGTTIFADLHAQGMLDAEPRARGLTCLRPSDTDPALAMRIEQLASDLQMAHLYCPESGAMLPHQRGEKTIGFLRLDQPFGGGGMITASLLQNRHQRLLYTPEFKYHRTHQQGQRLDGTLGNLTATWSRHRGGSALQLVARGSGMHMDRQLGAVALDELGARRTVGGVGLSRYPLLGEAFSRRPVDEQLAAGTEIPGHTAPGGHVGTPFGPAAEGIFFTEGTPHLVNWTRLSFAGGDAMVEYTTATGSVLQAGAGGKAYRIESYERLLAHVVGVVPFYARFYPGTAGAFAQARLAAADDVIIQAGVRLEAFRPGVDYRLDREDVLSPVVATQWKLSLLPRLAVSLPIPGTEKRTAIRFSWGRMAQAPDFRYFLDTAIGDSLRTDIRRQGNPNLYFESGSTYEAAVSQLLGERLSVTATLFRKEFSNLVAGNLNFPGVAEGQFTTGDFGSANGVELQARAYVPGGFLRGGYALQRAMGVATGAADVEGRAPGEARVEYPLAFDRRHAISGAYSGGRAGGRADAAWSASAVLMAMSGTPVDRFGGTLEQGGSPVYRYLPWTVQLNLRASREMTRWSPCERCGWRVVADGRNLLGRENVVAVRRDTGGLAPTLEELDALVAAHPAPAAISRESPRYSRRADLNRDGVITPEEFRAARFAAALDRYDPSLFFGEPRQLRLGLEVSF
jgi:hypothetical protein